jgi:hypothetical protein
MSKKSISSVSLLPMLWRLALSSTTALYQLSNGGSLLQIESLPCSDIFKILRKFEKQRNWFEKPIDVVEAGEACKVLRKRKFGLVENLAKSMAQYTRPEYLRSVSPTAGL